MAAVLDPEALGHRDLHALEVVPTPQWLEHRVREAQVQNLVGAHLPEEVIDPVELRLVDVLMELVRELDRRSTVVAKGLLDDDPRVLRQSGLRQALDDFAEEEWWDLEVEDRKLGSVDRLCDSLVRRGVGKMTRDGREPIGEAI